MSTKSVREVVDGLVQLVRLYDEPTGAHLDAVGALARKLAVHLGHDESTVERVELAARLHDVGKHSVPLHILHKPSSLTASEWEHMRRHPEYGATIARCFAPLEELVDIVRLHHERIDGRGYPEGRVGSEIPVEARIIAVVDAFHAMTVTRPYMQARSPRFALQEFLRCAGTQFEGEFVAAFIAMLGARGIEAASLDDPGQEFLGRRSTA